MMIEMKRLNSRKTITMIKKCGNGKGSVVRKKYKKGMKSAEIRIKAFLDLSSSSLMAE
jgi:hypothetical protein